MKRKLWINLLLGLGLMMGGLRLPAQSAAESGSLYHAAAQCPPDDYEPNDSFEEAYAISVGEQHSAYICPSGDDDWFRFSASAGQQITVALYGLYGDLPADYDLYLLDPWEALVAESTASGTTAEQIVHSAEQEGEYRVQVIGYLGAWSGMNAYRLMVTLSGEPTVEPTVPPDCPSDGYEPNDSFEEAHAISPGVENTAYICPSGDEDWFSFYASPGQELTVDLHGLYGDLPGDYDLYLHDPWETPVAESARGGNAAEEIIHTAEQEGEYRVKVIGYMGAYSSANPYRLMVTLSAEPTVAPTSTATRTPTRTPTLTPECPVDSYESNDNFEEARAVSVGVEHTAYICPSGDEDWFKFYATPGQEITVDLYGLYGDLPADYDLYLHDPWQTPVAESAAGGNAAEQIMHTAGQQGEYRVRVIGYMGASSGTNPYRLMVSGEPTATPTATLVPTATRTVTRMPTATRTATHTPTATWTATRTSTATPTATQTHTPTQTPTGIPTATRTPEPTITATPAAGFMLRRAVFGSAGQDAVSNSYRLRDTLGQGSPIGETRSGSFRLRGGFWHAPGEVTLPDFTVTAEVSPIQGGALTAPDGRVQISFPPAAVPERVTVTFTQRLAPAMYAGALLFAGNAFALDAAQTSGQPLTHFERPFTLTLHYAEPDWQQAGISAESSLSLYRWSPAGGQWLAVPKVSHDTATNVLVASLDHLTEFVLLGTVMGEGYTVYLPVIRKGY